MPKRVIIPNSFKQNASLINANMSLETFTCPWCHAENRMQINQLTVTDSVDLKGYGREEALVSQIPVYTTKCRLCLQEYEPIKASDFMYIKETLRPTGDMVQHFRTKFPTENDMSIIFGKIVAITRPKKSRADRLFGRNPHLHIFFNLNNRRAYIDAEQVIVKRKTILRGLSIEDI